MAKIQRNDVVMIIAGRDKGKKARVIRVITDKQRVMLDDEAGSKLRTIKKHTKPNQQTGAEGGIQELRPTVHISNVMLLDSDGKPTRVKSTTVDGKKQRAAVSNGAAIGGEVKAAKKSKAKK